MSRFTTLSIWVIGIGLMIGLTLKDFVPLFSDYLYNNTATQVQVVLLDENFKPPEVIVFIPNHKLRNENQDDLMKLANFLYRNQSCCAEGAEIAGKLIEKSWDVWNGRPLEPWKNFDTFYDALSLAFIRKLLLDIDNNMDIFEEYNSDWNGPIVCSAINHLQWQKTSDHQLKPFRKNEDGLDLSLHNYLSFPGHPVAHREKIDHIFLQLHKRFCNQMVYVEQDYATEFKFGTTTNSTCDDLFLNDDTLPFLGHFGLYIFIPKLSRPTVKLYEFNFIHNDSSLGSSTLLEETRADYLQTLILYSDISTIFAATIDPIFASYLYVTPSESRKVDQTVVLRYKVHVRTRETRPEKTSCHTQSLPGCFVRCSKEWIIQKCGCMPFSTRRLFPELYGLPFCNSAAYLACNVSRFPEAEKEQCVNKCTDVCDFISYSWHIAYVSSDPEAANRSAFSLKMVPEFDTFAEFTMTSKNSPQQFFSQLAGVGSLYTGISGLSIIALIFRCIDWIKRPKMLEKQRREEEKQERSRSELHDRIYWTEERIVQVVTARLARDIDSSCTENGEEAEWVKKLKTAMATESIRQQTMHRRIYRQQRSEADKDSVAVSHSATWF